jgi:hypothetical protein
LTCRCRSRRSHDRQPPPPKLLVKTIGVTFLTVALLLVVVFVVVTFSVRDQVRRAVTGNLESSQRTFSALETRRQHEMQVQAATLAENPTLKAALDTYQAEAPASTDASWRTQLLETIDRELKKVATRAESDALVLVDTHQATIASAGRLSDRWPRGRKVAHDLDQAGTASTASSASAVRSSALSPCRCNSTMARRSGCSAWRRALTRAMRGRTRASGGHAHRHRERGLVLASTLPARAAREFEVAVTRPVDGPISSTANRRVSAARGEIGDTSFYALGSIDGHRNSSSARRS